MEELYKEIDKSASNDVIKLYNKPPKEKKNEIPIGVYTNGLQLIDILYLPDDDGYKYCLTVIEPDTRIVDAEPMKKKDGKTVVNALKRIYNRKILKLPRMIKMNNESEYKEVKNYLKDNDVASFVTMTGRHRSMAYVEWANKTIKKLIMMKKTRKELEKGEEDKEWTSILPRIITAMNKKYKREGYNYEKELEKEPIFTKRNRIILQEGTKIRIKLDNPITTSGKKLKGSFREGDIRWSPKIYEIEKFIIQNKQPPLYSVKGIKTFFTRGQLQVV